MPSRQAQRRWKSKGADIVSSATGFASRLRVARVVFRSSSRPPCRWLPSERALKECRSTNVARSRGVQKVDIICTLQAGQLVEHVRLISYIVIFETHSETTIILVCFDQLRYVVTISEPSNVNEDNFVPSLGVPMMMVIFVTLAPSIL